MTYETDIFYIKKNTEKREERLYIFLFFYFMASIKNRTITNPDGFECRSFPSRNSHEATNLIVMKFLS